MQSAESREQKLERLVLSLVDRLAVTQYYVALIEKRTPVFGAADPALEQDVAMIISRCQRLTFEGCAGYSPARVYQGLGEAHEPARETEAYREIRRLLWGLADA